MKASRSPDTTFSEIVWQLLKSEDHTILIEPIFRQDLLHRFLAQVDNFREKYQYPDHPSYSQIEIVFHSTAPKNIPGIIQQGFLLPLPLDTEIEGQHCSKIFGEYRQSKHGQKWGSGIYFTKLHGLAAAYGDREVIIMCAVVMGRQFRFGHLY
jgi:hypothetical protein